MKDFNLFQKVIYLLFLFACFTPYIDAPIALLGGILATQFLPAPFPEHQHKITQWMLNLSIAGLGFSMNLDQVWHSGKDGLLLSVGSIAITLLLGYFLGKKLQLDKKLAYLISAGTAICGGSAIAALSPIVKARNEQISMALGTVFILNALALFIFPAVGHYFHMTSMQFGTWCAIAIHDTSSVVGAASKFGNEALQTATTIKLVRALWIVPVGFLTGFLRKNDSQKIPVPYVMLFFLGAILIHTLVPQFQTVYQQVTSMAQKCLVCTLFLIGTGLNKSALKKVGLRPMVQGVLLWVGISVLSLFVILKF
ncbi:putative sulfate exporter family transporter [Rapidithrix thailandica]|uniref:Sulfate exporter family transporter n=1 Tax=Rapidithrix thailandica TaxID=413964 RepID=A0AAW9RUQ4_9BACT